MPSWAIFGGSFDPPHVGHVLVAGYVLAVAPVDRVLVVPTLAHAFGKRSAPFPHRRRMLELAFRDLPRVEVSDLEAQLGGTSYTVRTLRTLRARHPDVDLRFVVGTDLVDEVPTWKEGEAIPELAPLFVVGRGGHGERDVTMPEVSSTEIRERMKDGRSVDALLPRAVREYIHEHGLYEA